MVFVCCRPAIQWAWSRNCVPTGTLTPKFSFGRTLCRSFSCIGTYQSASHRLVGRRTDVSNGLLSIFATECSSCFGSNRFFPVLFDPLDDIHILTVACWKQPFAVYLFILTVFTLFRSRIRLKKSKIFMPFKEKMQDLRRKREIFRLFIK